MADTLPNIDLPQGEWVDIYAATGIVVGRQLNLQNIGTSEIYIVAQAAEPNVDTTGFRVVERNDYVTNEKNDTGAWAISLTRAGLINVAEA